MIFPIHLFIFFFNPQVDPREDFALLPPPVQEQVVHLAHRLQLTNPPSQTEVKLELVEQFPATSLDWQLQISDIHSVGEELIQREEVKKKLRNNSREQDLPNVVEPLINGKQRKNLAETKSLKQDRRKQPN